MDTSNNGSLRFNSNPLNMMNTWKDVVDGIAALNELKKRHLLEITQLIERQDAEWDELAKDFKHE